MKINEVRKLFLEYFKGKGHTVVPSSNLIPRKDPTLLFANAGMNQFKDVFLGLDTRNYKKAVSCQKCVRAGGKHNDLENVGFTYRHHTFFEMLGNFSFGDYFKKDAIKYSWELLTKYYNIPEEKLFATVFKDDDEAYKIWREDIGLSENKIFKFGEKDNFWSMGDTGPCGPCSEIFYDHGKDHGCGKKECNVGCNCDRFVEIWNLVFMQYNRDEKGKLTPLPKPSIDTGAGLERLTAVMQGVASNYDIDLFKLLKKEIEKGAELKLSDKKTESSYNAIADHLRSIAFLISDGCTPSNLDAGYVLRRIIRRAIRHGKFLGFNAPFLYKKVGKVVELMGEAYPELRSSKNNIENILKGEEEKFFQTLDKGLSLLGYEIEHLKKGSTLDGRIAFKLHDTYGFPLDLTQMLCREKGVSIDEEGFKSEMDKQKKMARDARAKNIGDASGVNTVDIEALKKHLKGVKSSFVGYDVLITKSKCVKIIKDGRSEIAVFDKTTFYAESGGQTSDTGVIKSGGKTIADVIMVQKPVGGVNIHILSNVKAKIQVSKTYELQVNFEQRALTQRNHTATHMLQYLLRKSLGQHVKQAGSLVTPKFFTFDFTHYEKVPEDILDKIERELNLWILSSQDVNHKSMKYNDAVKKGVIALFDEKYEDKVRVVNVDKDDNKSAELCGGTHVKNTSEVGVFKILGEESTGAGVRRIKAVTSMNAYEEFSKSYMAVRTLGRELKCAEHEVIQKATALFEENRELRKGMDKQKTDSAKNTLDDDIKSADTLNGTRFVISYVDNSSIKDLKTHSDYIRTQAPDAVAFLYSEQDGKVSVVSYVPGVINGKIKAFEIIKMVADKIGGKGGGTPDFAQGGGGDISKLRSMHKEIKDFISGK
ncbi:MAG: alanine--tRNA ligase [Pseudomonadota bacterium]